MAAPQSRVAEPPGWQVSFLKSIGAPVNQSNLTFITEWFNEEHGQGVVTGNPGAGGGFNLFDTTLKTSGSSTLVGNTAGVQNYPTAAEGIQANVSTIEEAPYAHLLAGLRSGAPVSTLQAEEQASPWGQWSSYPSAPPSNVPSVKQALSDYASSLTSKAFTASNAGAVGTDVAPGQTGASENQNFGLGPLTGQNGLITGPLSSLGSWFEGALGEILLILFGFALVIVGLVITFHQEGNAAKVATE